jgi:glycosyltransferase involved in cell wall biosynthesis
LFVSRPAHHLQRSFTCEDCIVVHVLFDDEIFSTQVYGGISRYFTELIKGLVDIADMDVQLPFGLTVNRYLAGSGHFGGRMLGGGFVVPGGRTMTRMMNRRAMARALARNNYDIVHATLYDPTLSNRIGRAKLVITVHDMVPELMPQAVGGISRDFSYCKESLIAKADGVVAVSGTTAADIARLTHRPIDTISVIHHGISDEMRWKPGLAHKPVLPERFFLCVGQRRAYKNFLAVAPAFARVMRADSDLGLVCFGGGPFTEEEKAPFEAAGVQSRLIAASGDDRSLASVYTRALALVYPSLYEGFGMPILEAMVNRCPVVVQRRSCFPEIADDAALYFDPAQEDETTELLSRLVRDVGLRRQLAAAGLNRAASFTWQRCATQHAALYRSLAS